MTGATGRAPTTQFVAGGAGINGGSLLGRAAQGSLARRAARILTANASKQESPNLPKTAQGVDRALAIGMVLLCRGQVKVTASRQGEQIDLSPQLVKSWAHVAFCVMNSSERVTFLRRLERVAGVSSQGGWQYEVPQQLCPLFSGAERLPELGLCPKDARSVVHNIVLLAAHLPNPLVLKNGGVSDRSISLPPVSAQMMERIQSLIDRHLQHVAPLM